MSWNEVLHFFDFPSNGSSFSFILEGVKMLDQVEFFSCSKHEVHAFDAGDFLWLELGVAAHHHHEGLRIALHGSTHRIAAFCIGLVGDAAGVDDHHVGGIVNVHPCVARLLQLTCKGGGLTEIQLAAEGVEGRFLSQNHGRKGRFGTLMQHRCP